MMAMTTSDLPLERIARGKVRDVYAVDAERLLLVATDRVSAYDVVMAEPIPQKGAVLTQVSAWWFRQLGDVVKHHMISADAGEIAAAVPALKPHRAEFVIHQHSSPFRGNLLGGVNQSIDNDSLGDRTPLVAIIEPERSVCVPQSPQNAAVIAWKDVESVRNAIQHRLLGCWLYEQLYSPIACPVKTRRASVTLSACLGKH